MKLPEGSASALYDRAKSPTSSCTDQQHGPAAVCPMTSCCRIGCNGHQRGEKERKEKRNEQLNHGGPSRARFGARGSSRVGERQQTTLHVRIAIPLTAAEARSAFGDGSCSTRRRSGNKREAHPSEMPLLDPCWYAPIFSGSEAEHEVSKRRGGGKRCTHDPPPRPAI